ncbi:MAG: methionyl-tRNA formyltransferase [Burkholderiaceae bacterium]
MKIVFAGTPPFAAAALRAIVAAGHEVALVLTQPDRPAGRGQKLQASAVKELALKLGIAVLQPAGLRLDGKHAADAAQAKQTLEAVAPDVAVVAAYGLILPGWVLALPRHGCLNIHASLLPRWRGAAPIQRAIEAGDAETGITIMQMDTGLDTGEACLARALPIAPGDTSATLHDRLAGVGAELVVDALARLAQGRLPHAPQRAEGVTYANKIDKREAAIDWRASAAAIERRLRAFDPFPGASFQLGGETIKAWRGAVRPGVVGAEPGRIVSTLPGALTVACGEGCLELLELQRPGGKRLPARLCLAQNPPEAGLRLPCPNGDRPD